MTDGHCARVVPALFPLSRRSLTSLLKSLLSVVLVRLCLSRLMPVRGET